MEGGTKQASQHYLTATLKQTKCPPPKKIQNIKILNEGRTGIIDFSFRLRLQCGSLHVLLIYENISHRPHPRLTDATT